MITLTFQKLKPDGTALGDPMTVDYAPTELAFSKSVQYAEVAVPGLELPLLQFVRGDATTLNLELFFDRSDQANESGRTGVAAEVEAFHKLVSIDGAQHHPPLVAISWGSDFPAPFPGSSPQAGNRFTAAVLSLTRRFTLFDSAGTPLRCIVTLSLKHYMRLADQVRAINYQSSDHTRVHTVREGETLPLIAHDAYRDARLWRVIADHNGLLDVRRLTPGDRLELPPLT